MTSKIGHTHQTLPETVLQPQLLRMKFVSLAQFGKAIGWDLGFRQLERGQLAVPMTILKSGNFHLMDVGFNRRIHQSGKGPEGVVSFGMPCEISDDFKWLGTPVETNNLINFSHSNGFDGLTGKYRGITFALEKSSLEEALRLRGFQGDVDLLLNESAVLPTQTHSPIRKFLINAMKTAGLEDLYLHQRESSSLTNELASQLADTLLETRHNFQSAKQFAPKFVTDRALGILHDSGDWVMNVSDLCKAINCSPSTLQRSFVSEFGVSPKSYILSVRLSHVRDALADAPAGALITDIANEWGFWHMGQFASDFRRQFGCTPSEFLVR